MTLIDTLDELWAMERPAFRQERTWLRARSLMLGTITCLGRRTVTGVLCASGQQLVDWSAAYRLFEKERISTPQLFAPIRKVACKLVPSSQPLVAVKDDTLIRKSGRKVAGTSWRRDPLGPAFTANFAWAQRFLQVSLIVPEDGLHSRGRAIPIDLTHAPSAKKPWRNAEPEMWEAYRVDQ